MNVKNPHFNNRNKDAMPRQDQPRRRDHWAGVNPGPIEPKAIPEPPDYVPSKTAAQAVRTLNCVLIGGKRLHEIEDPRRSKMMGLYIDAALDPERNLSKDMLAMLVKVEWSGQPTPGEPDTCPYCGAERDQGHGEHCELDKLIAKAKAVLS